MKNMIVLLVLILSLPVTAGYEIPWHTINGGGGTSSGGQYTVMGTIAQPDTGEMAGDGYELLGGFWGGEPLCTVNFEHFVRFAKYWLDTGAALPADLYEDNVINGLDLKEFIDYWLWYCPLDWPLK